MNLRPYQSDLIRNLSAQWTHHDRVMAQLPTGGGKSVIFGAVAKEAIDNGKRILLLAHRQELITQAAGHLAHWCGDSSTLAGIAGANIGIVKSGYQLTPQAPIQVASVQSLGGRRSKLGHFDLVVIDESHHATCESYRAALDSCPGARVLGLTATPVRLDGSGFDDLFGSLVVGPSTAELIESGYLSKFKYYADPNPMTTKGVKQTCGDFSASSLAAANDSIELSGNLIASYRRYADGLRCVVFAINCQHSRDIAAAYNQAGIAAAHLDAETPAEVRATTLEAFKAGQIKVLCNVGLIDEGVDIPALEVVQIAKPTKSLSRFLQICGRVLRTAEGKEFAIIIDHTTNWVTHGLPDRPRQWTLQGLGNDGTKPKLERNRETGEIQEQEPVPVILPDVEFVDLMSDHQRAEAAYWEYELDRLKLTVVQKDFKKTWIAFRLSELKPPLIVWQKAGEWLGYQKGWAWHKYQESKKEPAA